MYPRDEWFDASEKGDQERLKKLSRKKEVDIRAKKDSNTALHLVVKSGRVGAMEWLLSQRNEQELSDQGKCTGLGIDTTNWKGITPLLLAAERGQLAIMQRLVELGANIRVIDKDGNGALHYAAINGHFNIVVFLLSQRSRKECTAQGKNSGLGLESPGQYEYVPLIGAAKGGHLAVLQYIVAQGGNVKVTDKLGNTALHFAAQFSGDQKTVEYLVKIMIDDLGLPIEARNTSGKTAEDLAINKGIKDYLAKFRLQNFEFFDTLRQGNLVKLKECVRRGAKLSVKDSRSNTALHLAIMHSVQTTIVEYLLDLGTEQNVAALNIESKGEHGKTPLLCAAQAGHLEFLKTLVRRGADTKAKSQLGNTALHFAAEFSGSLETAIYLVEVVGLSLDVKNIFGKRAEEVASRANIKEYLKKCKLKGHSNAMSIHNKNIVNTKLTKDEFLDVSRQGNLHKLKECVKGGVDLSTRDSDGNTALHHAALYSGSAATVDYLLDLGMQRHVSALAIEGGNQNGMTAFLCAAQKGQLEVLKAIVAKGATLDTKDSGGNTALHHAASCSDSVPTVEYLLDLGNQRHVRELSIESRNKFGFTGFLCAASKGQLNILKLFVSRGANLGARDQSGSTALHRAAGFTDSSLTVEYLLDLGKQKCVSELFIESQQKNGMTAFLCSAQRGNLLVLKSLVKGGADVEVRDNNGNTALHLATSISGNAMILDYLLNLSHQMVENNIEFESKNHQGKTAMLCAAQVARLDVLKKLVVSGSDIRTTDNYGNSALHIAASSYVDGAEKVTYLLDLGLRRGVCELGIETKNLYGMTALLCAAQNGQLGVIKSLLSRGANINAKNLLENNVLHCAAESLSWSSDEIARYLFELRALFLDEKNMLGKTAEDLAIRSYTRQFLAKCREQQAFKLREEVMNPHLQSEDFVGHYLNSSECIKWLASNAKGHTLFHLAVQNGWEKEVFDSLLKLAHMISILQKRAKSVNTCLALQNLINKKDLKGVTPLLIAAKNWSVEPFFKLFLAGADMSSVDGEQNSVLHIAAMAGNFELIVFLLRFEAIKAIIDYKNAHLETPLLLAVGAGHLQTAVLLIKAGADAHACDGLGNNALHALSHLEDITLAQYLVETVGVSIIENTIGQTPIEYAAQYHNRQLEAYLRTKQEAHELCSRANREVQLLSEQASALFDEIRCLKLKRLIFAAAESVNLVSLKSLADEYIAGDGDVSVLNEYMPEGCNALHLAASEGRCECVTFLVEQLEFAVNQKAEDGCTAYLYAAQNGQLSTCQELERLGVDINAVDGQGSNALHYAAWFSRELPVVKYLVEQKGFDINTPNSDGETALQMLQQHESNGGRYQADIEAYLSAKVADIPESTMSLLADTASVAPRKSWVGRSSMLPYQQAHEHFKCKDYTDALALLTAWITKPEHQRHAKGWLLMGQCYIRLKQQELALPYFEKTTEIGPDEPNHWAWLGVTYDMLSQAEKAYKCYLKFIKLSPDKPIGYEKAAKCCVQQNKFDQAYLWVLAANRYGASSNKLEELARELQTKLSAQKHTSGFYERQPTPWTTPESTPEPSPRKDSSSNSSVINQAVVNAFLNAVKKGQLETLSALSDKHRLSSEGVLDMRNELGDSPLHLAVRFNQHPIIEYLLDEYYFDVDCKGRDGNTAFLLAAEIGQIEMLSYLVDSCRADIKAHNDEGMNALHLAVVNRKVEAGRYLANHCPALATNKNKAGKLPRDLAHTQEDAVQMGIAIENRAAASIAGSLVRERTPKLPQFAIAENERVAVDVTASDASQVELAHKAQAIEQAKHLGQVSISLNTSTNDVNRKDALKPVFEAIKQHRGEIAAIEVCNGELDEGGSKQLCDVIGTTRTKHFKLNNIKVEPKLVAKLVDAILLNCELETFEASEGVGLTPQELRRIEEHIKYTQQATQDCVEAAEQQDFDKVAQMTGQDVSPNTRDKRGNTFTMTKIRHGFESAAAYDLTQGNIDIHAKNEQGQSLKELIFAYSSDTLRYLYLERESYHEVFLRHCGDLRRLFNPTPQKILMYYVESGDKSEDKVLKNWLSTLKGALRTAVDGDVTLRAQGASPHSPLQAELNDCEVLLLIGTPSLKQKSNGLRADFIKIQERIEKAARKPFAVFPLWRLGDTPEEAFPCYPLEEEVISSGKPSLRHQEQTPEPYHQAFRHYYRDMRESALYFEQLVGSASQPGLVYQLFGKSIQAEQHFNRVFERMQEHYRLVVKQSVAHHATDEASKETKVLTRSFYQVPKEFKSVFSQLLGDIRSLMKVASVSGSNVSKMRAYILFQELDDYQENQKFESWLMALRDQLLTAGIEAILPDERSCSTADEKMQMLEGLTKEDWVVVVTTSKLKMQLETMPDESEDEEQQGLVSQFALIEQRRELRVLTIVYQGSEQDTLPAYYYPNAQTKIRLRHKAFTKKGPFPLEVRAISYIELMADYALTHDKLSRTGIIATLWSIEGRLHNIEFDPEAHRYQREELQKARDRLYVALYDGFNAKRYFIVNPEQEQACDEHHQQVRARASTLAHFTDRVFPKLDRVTDTILGVGSYGEVRLAEHANQHVAVKTFSSEQSYDACKQEANLLFTFIHSSIVRFMGITNTLPHYLVMEYLPGGTLSKWLKDLPKEQVAPLVYFKMALDIGAAIAYLHDSNNSNCVVHGDIKTENVLLARQSIRGDDATQILREPSSVLAKVTDFGSARVLKHRSLQPTSLPAPSKQALGTWKYRAPELFAEGEQSTLAGDVYSFAWVLWELGTHAVPFAKDDYPQGKNKILRGERGTPAYEPQIDLEKSYYQLIQDGWQEDASKRSQAGDIFKQLQSIFKGALIDNSAAKTHEQRTQSKTNLSDNPTAPSRKNTQPIKVPPKNNAMLRGSATGPIGRRPPQGAQSKKATLRPQPPRPQQPPPENQKPVKTTEPSASKKFASMASEKSPAQSPTKDASSAGSKVRQMSLNEMPNEMKFCSANAEHSTCKPATSTTTSMPQTGSARANNPAGVNRSSKRFGDSRRLSSAYDADTSETHVKPEQPEKPDEHQPPPAQAASQEQASMARRISFSKGSNESSKKSIPKPQ